MAIAKYILLLLNAGVSKVEFLGQQCCAIQCCASTTVVSVSHIVSRILSQSVVQSNVVQAQQMSVPTTKRVNYTVGWWTLLVLGSCPYIA